jgi:hypothetical protein
MCEPSRWRIRGNEVIADRGLSDLLVGWLAVSHLAVESSSSVILPEASVRAPGSHEGILSKSDIGYADLAWQRGEVRKSRPCLFIWDGSRCSAPDVESPPDLGQ